MSLSAPAGKCRVRSDERVGPQGRVRGDLVGARDLDRGVSRRRRERHFTVSLQPGQYQVICGAPSNTRADLVVTGEGEAAPSLQVDQADLDAAVTDYQTYVLAQTEALATTPRSSPTRSAPATSSRPSSSTPRCGCRGRQIEPVAELFPDSDGVIDSRADDFPEAEADPDFTGFHALEYGLWSRAGGRRRHGRARRPARHATSSRSSARSRSLEIQPQVMTNGAAALIEEAAQTQDHRRGGAVLRHRPGDPGRRTSTARARSSSSCRRCSHRRHAARRRSHGAVRQGAGPPRHLQARPTGSSPTAR